MEHVYLSRRNLLTLLSKLDRQAAGEQTFCSVLKNDNVHPQYPQTMDHVLVTAIEDDAYYAHREAGLMHPEDDPHLKDPSITPSVARWPWPV